MGKRTWTAEQERYLEAKYGSLNIKLIMEHLGKTYYSVKRKANEMGLERDIYEGGAFMSTMVVKDILGCAKSTLRHYANMGYIKYRYSRSFEKKYMKFSVEGVINFMVKYPDKWKYREYDKDMLQLLFLDYRGNEENINLIKNIINERNSYWRKESISKVL